MQKMLYHRFKRNKPKKSICHDIDVETGEVIQLTQQQHLDDCNINKIMEKIASGRMVMPTANNPQYGDFSSGISYQEALDSTERIKNEFSKLPAAVKRKFGQDPSKLIDYLADSKNRKEAIEIGLIEDKPPQKSIGDVVNAVEKLSEKINSDSNGTITT